MSIHCLSVYTMYLSLFCLYTLSQCVHFAPPCTPVLFLCYCLYTVSMYTLSTLCTSVLFCLSFYTLSLCKHCLYYVPLSLFVIFCLSVYTLSLYLHCLHCIPQCLCTRRVSSGKSSWSGFQCTSQIHGIQWSLPVSVHSILTLTWYKTITSKT